MKLSILSIASDLSLGLIKCHVTLEVGENREDFVRFFPYVKGEEVSKLNEFVEEVKLYALQNTTIPESAEHDEEEPKTDAPAKRRGRPRKNSVEAVPASVEPIPAAPVAPTPVSVPEPVVESPVVTTPVVESPAPVEAPVVTPEPEVEEEEEAPKPEPVLEYYVKGKPEHATLARELFTTCLCALVPGSEDWSKNAKHKEIAKGLVNALCSDEIPVLADGEEHPELKAYVSAYIKKALG